MREATLAKKATSRSNYNAIILIAFLATSGLKVVVVNPPNHEKVALLFGAPGAGHLLFC
jgi:hypothetical protein